MKQFLWNAVDSSWLAPVLGGAVGIAIFICTFGLQVVVPTNVDWLLAGGDLSQHYIGWQFFSQSDWTFPIGVASDLAYPHGLAITFMDSLPLLAIPAKMFAGVLPEHFQYFGLWGLMSYAAIGMLAALIARRFTKNPWIIALVAMLLCFCPLVFQRMFTHTALAGQWIILAGIYATLRSREWRFRTNVAVWSSLLSVSVLIHPYFLPMSIFILVVSTVLRYKTALRAVLEITLPTIFAVITTWLIGGFTFTTISGQKFGGAGYDLAAPFLANGWSVLDFGSPQVRFEMFAYLGMGGLLLIFAAVILLFLHRKFVLRIVAAHRVKVIILIVITFMFLLVTVGPTIKIAGAPLFTYDVPTAVEKIWGIFRVTARLAWPLLYGVLVLAMVVVLKFTKPKIAMGIMALVCVLQVLDIGLSTQFTQHTQKFHNVQSEKYQTRLVSPVWSQLAEGKKHVVYLGDLYDDKFVNISQFSLAHRLTLNTGYFARKPTVAIEQTIVEAKQRLVNGTAQADTIYIYDSPIEAATSYIQQELDGYFVIVR